MNVDPSAMNNELNKKENKRYQKRDNFSEETPAMPLGEEEISFDGGGDGFQWEEEAQKTPAPKQRVAKQAKEEEIVPGLYDSDLTSWKKQYEEIHLVTVKGKQFVIRPLERFEYKEIIGAPNTDPLMREEMMCEYCVLFPQQYDFTMMSGQKAGYPAILSEVIMDHSGFTKDVQVQRL